MAQLTLRTLLAYIDDTLEPALARQLGQKVAESDIARELIERIKKVTRRRGLKTPTPTSDDDGVSDPNTVAEYLSNTLDSEQLTRLEETCLESDVHLAEVAAVHQILTVVLTEPVRVPPQARQRMYKLVLPPASEPNRKPGKTLPVGGVAPGSRERAEPDDADATLLLGLGRYGGGSAVRRLGLVASVAGLALLLGVAVLLALPHRAPDPPETSAGTLYAAAPVPPPPVVLPKPKEAEDVTPPPAKPKGPDEAVVAPPPKPKEGKLDLVKRVAPPRAERVPVGRVEGVNTLVLTRAADGPAWLRLDAAGEAGVSSADQVLALPGYKADIQLDSGVKVHLWGNVPELLPARLLETRVRFHAPQPKAEGKGDEFDADLTLLAGRIYLTTTKPTGSRVRVRFSGETWDITLHDPKTEVMVESVTGFDPGTPYAREGGPLPRVEAQVALLRGTADIAAPDRFKTFDKLTAPTAVAWDSKGGALADPRPVEAGNAYYDKFPPVGAELGKAIQRALTDMALRAAQEDRAKITLVLAEYLTTTEANKAVVAQVAVYAQAAVASGPTAGDQLKPLVDALTDENRQSIRLAAVYALAAWVAQAPGNTALLDAQLAPKLPGERTSEVVLRLLRGAVSPVNPDPADLDKLVGYLTHPSIAVRELAQWNLINFVDPMAPKTVGVMDVAATGPGYDKFVKAWTARVAEIKARPPEKK